MSRELQSANHRHRIRLVRTNWLICSMTFSSQVMTLTWGQILMLTFLGQRIYHSMARQAKDVGVLIIIILSLLSSKFLPENDFVHLRLFYFVWPLEAKQWTWGQIWLPATDRKGNELAFAFFCSVLAPLVHKVERLEEKISKLSRLGKIDLYLSLVNWPLTWT